MRISRFSGVWCTVLLLGYMTGGTAAQKDGGGAKAQASASSETAAAAGAPSGPGASAKAAQKASASSEQELEFERRLASLRSDTEISSRLESSIDARKAKPGDELKARVTEDVKQDGQAVIRKGDRLLGRVTAVEGSAEGDAGSKVSIVFDRLARGQAIFDLKTTVSSIVRATQPMPAGDQPIVHEPMMIPHGGGSAGGGASLGGGLTSTAGAAVGAAGSAVGSATSTVGGAARSTLSGGGSAAGAAARGEARSGSSLGLSTPLRDIRVESQQGASQQAGATSVLSTRRGSLRLDSGTELKLRVAAQTEAPARKR